ncbi:hypothetical protein DAPPUDRAFT_327068 [Daphnia pulex]|uniref:Uncharacterized protein n=1 Tax=Daphnia pulex TaxID=6669 RepID=E9H9Q7_DAPPU|nr:hypothetical protein DAPPUDRAFT_327068 [Daphnia pulex]|eukprot:EFX71567.1 hypothetical protein DAPPUDRAFT_327068 [Daphnia pulex]
MSTENQQSQDITISAAPPSAPTTITITAVTQQPEANEIGQPIDTSAKEIFCEHCCEVTGHLVKCISGCLGAFQND